MLNKTKTKKLTVITMLVFIVMNFVLSMSSVLFNGILDKIAIDLNVPLSSTGNLVSFYAYGAGIGVPIFLVLFRKFHRDLLLKWMLFFNILTTTASILAPNFTILLITRFLMGLTGNCYGVLATANIAALSPKDKVGRNLSLLITGGACSLMIGVPLTRILIATYPWQVIFVVLIILMIISLCYLIFNLPEVSQVQKPVHLKDELSMMKQRNVAITLLSSIITFVGYGAFYTYLTPYLVESFPQLDVYMGVILCAIGFCSFSGNLLGGFVCDRIGYYKSLCLGTAFQLIISILIFITKDIMIINLILVFIWMINGWFIGLQINTGITIVTENKSSLMISLNTSGIQLGQAIGTSIISVVITSVGISFTIVTPIITSLIVLIILILNYKHDN